MSVTYSVELAKSGRAKVMSSDFFKVTHFYCKSVRTSHVANSLIKMKLE